MRDPNAIGMGTIHAVPLRVVASAQDCASMQNRDRALPEILPVQQRSAFIRNSSQRPCIVGQVEAAAR